MARWVFAVTAAMLVASAVEYAAAHQRIVDRTLEESLRSYGAQVAEVEDALAIGSDPKTRDAAIDDELHRILHTYGTLYVGLFDRENRLVASAEGGPAVHKANQIHAGRLAEVLTTGQATVEIEGDEGEGGQEGRYEFLLPVSSPGGTLVLEIDQRADIITEHVADLRLRRVLGLLGGTLIAIPLSYVFGGRTLHRRQLQAEREADVDALTNLAGRRPFRPALDAALSRKGQTPATLALIDLDGFKQINDRLGHSHGDRILNTLADSFAELHASETAFRLGGDEFAVILPGSDEDRATVALERVRAALTGAIPGVTFSAGVASSTGADPAGSQELWERADAALYEAKRRGGGQSVTFGSMAPGHIVNGEKIAAVTALVAGKGPIGVAFQPIWDLRRGVVLAHEALLRLPTDSPISGPQEAFDLAERLGLAGALDSQARNAVLAVVQKGVWEGLLFLNIHPAALAGLDVAALAEDLAACGLKPADVVLEVTEQTGMDHPEPIHTLRAAQERGFRLALDDMGRGNAGLRALALIRFDIIKIDGEVVSRLGSDPSSAATVAAATAFVERTGGWLVAEGIEQAAMIDALLQSGHQISASRPVLAGQGYLLGCPAPRPVTLDTRLPVLDRDPSRAGPDGREAARIESANP